MTEDKLQRAASAVRDIVEAVPIYKDAMQPAAQTLGEQLVPVAEEVGRSLQTVAKTISGSSG
jgi:hypothetical protein